MSAGACQQTEGDSMTEAALNRLLAMTPEMRAKVILELKRRQDGGLILRKPKLTPAGQDQSATLPLEPAPE
jgi:hypothetical protein